MNLSSHLPCLYSKLYNFYQFLLFLNTLFVWNKCFYFEQCQNSVISLRGQSRILRPLVGLLSIRKHLHLSQLIELTPLVFISFYIVVRQESLPAKVKANGRDFILSLNRDFRLLGSCRTRGRAGEDFNSADEFYLAIARAGPSVRDPGTGQGKPERSPINLLTCTYHSAVIINQDAGGLEVYLLRTPDNFILTCIYEIVIICNQQSGGLEAWSLRIPDDIPYVMTLVKNWSLVQGY